MSHIHRNVLPGPPDFEDCAECLEREAALAAKDADNRALREVAVEIRDGLRDLADIVATALAETEKGQ